MFWLENGVERVKKTSRAIKIICGATSIVFLTENGIADKAAAYLNVRISRRAWYRLDNARTVISRWKLRRRFETAGLPASQGTAKDCRACPAARDDNNSQIVEVVKSAAKSIADTRIKNDEKSDNVDNYREKHYVEAMKFRIGRNYESSSENQKNLKNARW